MIQFSVTSFVILAAVAAVLIYTLSNMIRSNAIADLIDEAVGATSQRILRTITPEDLQTPMTGERYDKFHKFVQSSIVSDRTARIKLWAPDGTVIYSNDPAGVGEKFPDNANLLKALSGENAVEIKVPQDAENDRERDLGTLMEVYTPVMFPGETRPGGVFEIYQYYAPVAQRISDLRRLVILSVIGGFAVLYAGLVFIVGSGWKTITRQRNQLETVNFELADRVTEVRDYNEQLIQEASERALVQDALRQSESEARQLAYENEALAEIGRIISSSLDLDEVFEGFARQVAMIIPFDRLSISFIDMDQGIVTVAYSTGAVRIPGRMSGDVVPIEGTLAEEVSATRSTVVLQDVTREHIERHFSELMPSFDAGVRSFIGVPLVHMDEVAALLQLRSLQTHPYSQWHITLAERVGGQIAGAISNSLLFSERQKAEEALRYAEEKYRTFVENAKDCIVVLQNGQVVYRNPAYDELLGYTVEQTAGQSFLDNVAPEHRELVREHYRARLRGEDAPEQYEVDLITRDGSRVSMEVRPRVIEYQNDQATLVTMRDVTERKRLEQQLIRSQKMESIGLLAGGVAHDFNNLLSAVIGYSELAAIQLATHGQVNPKYLDEIQLSGERGTQLTRQLLAFSRRQVPELKTVNLNDLIVNLDGMLRRLIGEHVELVMITAMDPATVKTDPGQMEQVLVNLAVNARDAMPAGGRLTIQTQNIHIGDEISRVDPEAQPGEYVMTTVTDNGIGMPPEVLSRVFEPFFTTKRAGEGTGLGLSTSYGIIKQNSGYMSVESQPGEGTTFTIYMPKVGERPELSYQPDRIDDLLVGTETVLVVEDESVVRQLTAEVLQRQGYRLLSASNGAEAVRVMKGSTEQIDLLLTDVVMPIMGGQELAKRYSLAYPDGKVLYMSGYPAARLSANSLSGPEGTFLQKPITLSELTMKVRQTLDGQPTAVTKAAD